MNARGCYRLERESPPTDVDVAAPPSPCRTTLPSPAANITLTPADLQTFAPYLPIDGGNATLVLLGAAPDSARTRVDWGGGVAVLHQPPGRTFLSVNLELRGMAPPSAGLSRGLPLQTLKAYMW